MPDAGAITEVTLGEVYRLLEAQGKTLGKISESMAKHPTWEAIDRLEDARDAGEQLQNKAIKALEDANTWLVRTVIAALIAGLGSLVVAVSKSLPL